MNLATENAKSSAGLTGTAPPKSVYLQKGRYETYYRTKKNLYGRICWDLPASPILSPHFGFGVLVGLEIFTVEPIAGVNLYIS